MSVAIIDYGSGNLHSAAKAFERAAREAGTNERVVVTADPHAVEPLIRRHRLPQRSRQTLETGLDDMMAVLGIEIFDMQADAGILGEGLEPFLEQLGVHLAQFRLGNGHLPDQVGPVRGIERHFRERLVHRDHRAAVAPDAGAAAQRLGEAFAQHDAGILRRVVIVDM